MSYDFPICYINDLSDIPEEHTQAIRIMLLSRRTNELSRQPNGAQIVFVYNIDGQIEAKLADRIKDVDSYLHTTNDNYRNNNRNQWIIEKAYILQSTSIPD